MASPILVYADRVSETSTTTGTGSLTLGGAPTGYQTFNGAVGANVYFYYAIMSAGSEWEVGRGYLSDSTTLVRETILASSNSGSVVNLSAGTKSAIITWPAFIAQRSSTLGQDICLSKGVFLP